jgi:putative oligomerization/nucleic acid binding protein
MGLLRGVARTAVVAGTATAVSNRVSRRQANRWAAQDAAAQRYAQPAPPPQAAPVAVEEPDMYEQLRKLAELKDAGILTEEEFAAKKAKILDI